MILRMICKNYSENSFSFIANNYNFYIAYGSNISTENMKNRCPDSILVGAGIITNCQLAFKKRNNKCMLTLIESKDNDDNVDSVVYLVSPNDEKNLDIYEECPCLYRKEKCKIVFENHKNYAHETYGFIYIMNKGKKSIPNNEYLIQVIKGYTEFNFDNHKLTYKLKNID